MENKFQRHGCIELPLRTEFGGTLDISNWQMIWEPYVGHSSSLFPTKPFTRVDPLFLALPLSGGGANEQGKGQRQVRVGEEAGKTK